MSRATDLEKLTARIHRLLECESTAVVTWNAKVPDPDNPKQLRQIDVEIVRDGISTHVECRSHVEPQSTKWIEELIGRKISLNADQMIAVSESGFTEGAILKANRFGIILRSISELTDFEIMGWGKQTEIELHYYQLVNVQVALGFHEPDKVSQECLQLLFTRESDLVSALANSIKYRVNELFDKTFPLCIQQDLGANGLLDVCGARLINASIRAEVECRINKFRVPFVSSYSFLQQHTSDVIATIESDKDSELEVIKSGKLTSITLNLSKLPPSGADTIFGGVIWFDLQQPSSAPKVELTGQQEQPVLLSNVEVTVYASKA
jgi:hypothetical protein